MKLKEFDEQQKTLACRYDDCKALGALTRRHPIGSPHSAGAWCDKCSRFNFWIRKPENENKRRNISSEERLDVWAAYGNRCAHCNLTIEQVKMLGSWLTVQHAPAFTTVQDDGELIPYCSDCQEDATQAMKRRDRMIKLLQAANVAS